MGYDGDGVCRCWCLEEMGGKALGGWAVGEHDAAASFFAWFWRKKSQMSKVGSAARERLGFTLWI